MLKTTIADWQLEVLDIQHNIFLYSLLLIYITYTKISNALHCCKQGMGVVLVLLHSCCRDIILVIHKPVFPTMTAKNRDFNA